MTAEKCSYLGTSASTGNLPEGTLVDNPPGNTDRFSDGLRPALSALYKFFNLYSQFANSWVMMDNSVRRRPRVIAKRSIGRAVRVFNADRWNAFRAQYEQKDPDKS